MAHGPKVCASCGDINSIHKHHLIPQVAAGACGPSVWLCARCHAFVHGRVGRSDHAMLTRIGLEKARAEGRIGGNPGLRAGDPAAVHKMRAARNAAYLKDILADLDAWLPTVRQMRPAQSWGEIVRVLNHTAPSAWTVERLRRTVRRLAAEGIVEALLLGRAKQSCRDDRLMRLVTAIATAAPDRTLREIGAQLEAMGERTPRGGTRWHASSVQNLRIQAAKAGLCAPAAPGVV